MADLTLKFNPFGRHRLRDLADDQGRSLDALLAAALTHLESATESDRVAAVPPRFLVHRSSAELSVRMAAPASRLERLRAEALRRRVPAEMLAEHALLLYLADESDETQA
jgi:hypothetical protein